jgi:hypothetical protein
MGDARWHAVRTRAGFEASALVGVEASGIEGYLPVEVMRLNLRGNRKWNATTWRPVFSQHLFARLDPAHNLVRLKEVEGIDDIVRPNGRLTPIDDGAIAAIRAAERAGRFDSAPDCRQAVTEDEPFDSRFVRLVAKIRKARFASERNGVLTAILMCKT